MHDEPDYNGIKDRFEARGGTPIRDDAFLTDAVIVFVNESLRRFDELRKDGKPLTVGDKAALAIVARLVALPDDDNLWRVTFPYPFISNENRLSPAGKKARALALDVIMAMRRGEKLTYALPQVAAAHHVSYSTVRAAYYEWEEYLTALLAKTPSGWEAPDDSE